MISQIQYSLVEFPYLCKSVQSVGVLYFRLFCQILCFSCELYSPTDFTDSHRLLVCVCLNLLGFHRFSILWWNFRICVNLCNLWEYYIFVYSVRYYVSLVNYILPQISQILTDCWCAFVLIFLDFTDWWNFRICVNLCNLWEYYIFVYSVRYYVSLVNYILPQISQILTDCWCAFVLIFLDFTDSVFLGEISVSV